MPQIRGLWLVLLACMLGASAIGFQTGCPKRPKEEKKQPMEVETEERPNKPKGPPTPFVVFVKPDAALANAVDKVYMRANDQPPVDLVVGWSVKFQALKALVDNTNAVEWWLDDVKQSTGEEYVFTPTAKQIYSLKCVWAKNTILRTHTRDIRVAKVQIATSQMWLEKGDAYAKDDKVYANWVRPPVKRGKGPAILFRGIVKADFPPGVNATDFGMGWSFAQTITEDKSIREYLPVHPGKTTIPPGTPAGTKIPCPEKYVFWNIPKGTQDSLSIGVNTYQERWLAFGVPTDDANKFSDSPCVDDPKIQLKVPVGGKQFKVTYDVSRDFNDTKFLTHQVVYHKRTRQVVPLYEQAWHIKYDSAALDAKTEVYVTIPDPPQAATTPTASRFTTASDYTSEKPGGKPDHALTVP